MSLQEKIKDIQKEDISQQEKMRKIQDLYKSLSNLKLDDKEIKCEHYERKCELLSPCCNKWIGCRFCHNDNNLCDLKMDRFKISKIRCKECKKEQDVSNKCINCEINFTESFCNICKVWTKDKIWHCTKCGFCRIGEELYHCDICDKCWPNETHPCTKKLTSRDEKCPVCLEELFTSKKSAYNMKCGHQMHSLCFNDYIKTKYNCPICKKSLFDMTQHWEHMKQIKSTIQIPEEYMDIKLKVSCFDCEKECETEFCIDNFLECKYCNGFNVQKI
jgi:hypothetical protein